MRLIPGVLVAPSVISAIDSNHDGVFSEAEEQAYAQRVLGDLSIAIDGKSVSPQLLSWIFPEPTQMREGLGEIQIEYRVELPSGGPNRALILANHHLNTTSVYLMNAVVPEDRNIRILVQKRNESAVDLRTGPSADERRGFIFGLLNWTLTRVAERYSVCEFVPARDAAHRRRD